MRKDKDGQLVLGCQPSNLKITNDHFGRYEAIFRILDGTPEILRLVHQDLEDKLEKEREENGRRRRCRYTSDNILRILLCQVIEGESLRGIVVRVDDSNFLRGFTGINDGSMVDFSTLCRLKNAIREETWRKINLALARSAVANQQITGEKLRLDTTAFEANIRYPTDSGLLWDTYRVVSRHIARAREIDPGVVGGRRVHLKKAKGLYLWITRKVGKKGTDSAALKERYLALIGHVEGILAWAVAVAKGLARGLEKNQYSWEDRTEAEHLVDRLHHYCILGAQVVDQTRRRVLDEEKVPAEEKLLSIYEPHVELLARGKAGKSVEFGHMVLFQQTEEKFITDYGVYEKRPVDHALVEPALKSHRRLFGHEPDVLTADKGFYQSMKQIHQLEKRIDVVAIGKKGNRTEEETARERRLEFMIAQKFRAGIEGTISFLKRVLRMFRCFNKGWAHFQATVGATVVAHNLLVLARGEG
jgi:IS5 family transposase